MLVAADGKALDSRIATIGISDVVLVPLNNAEQKRS